MHKYTNALIHSTSPYLLQHAHNPVAWQEWNEKALNQAIKEDKPILVSIGYSACHWCHVMERESFENETVANVMNQHFVCIKVDREERPDIDQLYMDAVQALGVNGGWPLNVFLTPDQKPFFGGTYFSPQNWMHVLHNIQHAYTTNRTQINQNAAQIVQYLSTSELQKFTKPDSTVSVSDDAQFETLSAKFDLKWGGFDRAPKFVMPSVWLWMLRYAALSKNQEAVKHTLFTLTKIAQGGIYDQIGGGFSRYAVDVEWFAPHFEKMLYDNAQLLSVYSEAYQLSKDPLYKTVVYETFSWLVREMTDTDGGFYSALDADTEGIEGKYYTWTWDELEQTLHENTALVANYFKATPQGNWEHGRNILIAPMDDQSFSASHNLTQAQWSILLLKAKDQLRLTREKRPSPALDDKKISGWNAMMVNGLIDAYKAFGENSFLRVALNNLSFIKNRLKKNYILYRSFKEKHSETTGFLDDYAYYIQACINMYQVTFDRHWLTDAQDMLESALTKFFDEEDQFFFYTDNQALIARKKEMFDNVIPSSNALMAQNLHYLGVFFDRPDYLSKASAMVDAVSFIIQTEPHYMSHWAMVAQAIQHGLSEIVLVGNSIEAKRAELQSHYLPFTIFMGGNSSEDLPNMMGKKAIDNQATFYVCQDRSCKPPVHTVQEALDQIRQKR
jgi:uncharacterized protein YyaL (SSP411 family)